MRNLFLKHKGQSTIEFLITLTFLFGFLFLYAKVAFNYTNGYLAQYGTFMASRSYLVFDSNSINEAEQDYKARDFAETNVFLKIVSESIARYENENGQSNYESHRPGPLKANYPGETLGSLYTGLYYDFQQYFSFSNLVGGRVPMSFRSESFIGREPTRSECLRRIRDSFRNISGTDDYELHVTFEDNGC